MSIWDNLDRLAKLFVVWAFLLQNITSHKQ